MAKNKRKSITTKLRFEIFKRDKFTCQYCGRSAPNVILEIDHLIPVSHGGTNELSNLFTSCFECNRGKRDSLLIDLPNESFNASSSILNGEEYEYEYVEKARIEAEDYFTNIDYAENDLWLYTELYTCPFGQTAK